MPKDNATFTITTIDVLDGETIYYKECTDVEVCETSLALIFNNKDGKQVVIAGVPFRVEED